MSANLAGSKNRAIEIIHTTKQTSANCIKTQTYTSKGRMDSYSMGHFGAGTAVVMKAFAFK